MLFTFQGPQASTYLGPWIRERVLGKLSGFARPTEGINRIVALMPDQEIETNHYGDKADENHFPDNASRANEVGQFTPASTSLVAPAGWRRRFGNRMKETGKSANGLRNRLGRVPVVRKCYIAVTLFRRMSFRLAVADAAS